VGGVILKNFGNAFLVFVPKKTWTGRIYFCSDKGETICWRKVD